MYLHIGILVPMLYSVSMDLPAKTTTSFIYLFVICSLRTPKHVFLEYSYFSLIAKLSESYFSKLDPSSTDSGKCYLFNC